MRIRSTKNGFRALCLAALLALISFGVSACGGDSNGQEGNDTGAVTGENAGSGDSSEQVSLAFFGLASENAYSQAMFQAAEAKAAELNATIRFFDGQFDGAAQINQMQDAITSGQFDGFMVMPNDQSGIVPIVEQAIAEGIKVAALQFPIGPDPTEAKPQVEGLTTSVIEDVVRGAQVTGEAINDMCVNRDPCKVAILWGSRNVTWDGPAKRDPLIETLDPNVKIVAEADGEFLQEPGQQLTADILQAHPDLDVLATPSGDQMTLGGQRAIEAAGKSIGLADRPDDAIAIVGYGAASSGVERVREGVWYNTYALVPGTMGEVGAEMIIAAIRGEAVESDGLVQTEISPIGDNVTVEVLEEHPDWEPEWEG